MESISLWYQKIAWIDLHIHKLNMNVPRLKLSLVNNSAIILIIIFTQQVRAKFVLWKSSQWHKKLYIKQHLKYAQRLPLRKHILNKPHQAWWIISFSFELNYHFLNWDWRQLYIRRYLMTQRPFYFQKSTIQYLFVTRFSLAEASHYTDRSIACF